MGLSLRINQRTALSFFVIAVFALSTTFFILQKAEQAIAEIEELSSQRIYFIRQ